MSANKELKEFIHAADQLVKYSANIKEIPESKHTVATVSARKEELRDLWVEVKARYTICCVDHEEAEDFDATTFESKYALCNETYITCLGYLCELMTQLTRPAEPVPSPSGNVGPSSLNRPSNQSPNVAANSFIASDSNAHCLKLPACDTEIFHGDYLSWPAFRDMFEAIYINHSRLSPVEQLFHLRAKTRGEAFNLVSKFPLTNASFALAWESLRSTYENTRILVNNHVKKLLNLPLCPNESAAEIKHLQNHINDSIAALKGHGVLVDTWGPILVFSCCSRLPASTLSLWEQSLEDPSKVPKWEQLDKFLSSRYQILETIADVSTKVPSVSSSRPRSNKNNSSNNRVSTFHTKSDTVSCKLCPAKHYVRSCSKFLSMTVPARIEFVQKSRLCYNCLSADHMLNSCMSRFSCNSCGKRHHTLLHKDLSTMAISQQNNVSSMPSASTSSAAVPHVSDIGRVNHANIQSTSPPSLHHSYCASSQRKVLLATELIKIVGIESNHIVRALIDPGSEVSLISESTQKRLNLPVSPINVSISSISAAHAASSRKLCAFSIFNEETPLTPISVQAIVLRTVTSDLPSASFSDIDPIQINGLRLADPTFARSAKIDVLIGADLYPAIVRNGLQTVCESLVAQNTIFGWILSGPIPQSFKTFSAFVDNSTSSSLDEQIKRFWELEEIGSPKKILTTEEKFCEDLFTSTTTRQSDGRYVVRLPFKPVKHCSQLGLSRNIAYKQFLRTEKGLERNLHLKSVYFKVVSEYLQLGHMKRVERRELVHEDGVFSFYLPHHAVLKPDSASTKVRVVFNASSSSSTGTSLNDLLYAGPVLQRDLTSLIVRWRFYRFVFNADIEKMYRQILVHPNDTPFQRILFRFGPEGPVEDCELLTVTFGINCAPFLAIRTLEKLADDHRDQYPLAAQIVLSEFYVDDALSGAHDLVTAQKAQQELIALLESGGFPLRKWTSNTSALLDHLPTKHLLSDNFLTIDKESTTKTLGVRWNAKEDVFYFSTPCIPLSSIPSKRAVFSQIAKLFDPAGWLAPIIITAKALIQSIWVEKTEWDEAIQGSSLETWRTFVESFPDIQYIKIPRWVDYSPATNLQFHGFCDASQKAYAAALYVRIENGDGTCSSHLVCAKTRIAPIKTVSLPRLELCGAVLLSRLIKTYIPQLPVTASQTFLWSDSAIVLAWLKKHPSNWKTFVANRTSEILENVGNLSWKHVKSSENPADLATRGMSPRDLRFNDLWWTGPSWLRQPENHWPRALPVIKASDELETKVVTNFATADNPEDILERFSSLPRALRVLTQVFRFYFRARKNHSSIFAKFFAQVITQKEMNFVKVRLISLSQTAHYPREVDSLSRNKLISTKSSILSLNPVLDANRLLRVNGRLTNAILTIHERHPIILPYGSHFTRLLVQFIHELSLHGGNALMLQLIRQMFWVPKVKNLIKFCIQRCKVCCIHKQKLRSQLMAALPTERVTFSPPFSHTGIDFAGPFEIKSSRTRGCRITKGYACLFVCFSTKAIHLEAASDLSSQVFLAAFARFVARRGLPQAVFTDHGTNFVGADTILRKEFKKFLESVSVDVRSKYGFQGLEWNFIPPGAPHMGGLWEAGVKSFKTHLRKLGKTSRFTFEEFATLLARIEACLNSRPISPASSNPGDLSALTPGHFLRGSPLLTFPEPESHAHPLSLLNRWENLKCLQQQFCRRWKEEYLKELYKRNKWKQSKENVKIDDLVVIKQENLPSNEWRLGRIIKIHPGTDGKVRVATIKTQQGEITRPIVKLCVLPNEKT